MIDHDWFSSGPKQINLTSTNFKPVSKFIEINSPIYFCSVLWCFKTDLQRSNSEPTNFPRGACYNISASHYNFSAIHWILDVAFFYAISVYSCFTGLALGNKTCCVKERPFSFVFQLQFKIFVLHRILITKHIIQGIVFALDLHHDWTLTHY